MLQSSTTRTASVAPPASTTPKKHHASSSSMRQGVCFVAEMSTEELEADVPRYLRGRLQAERINSFVAAFNRALGEKYALMARYAERGAAIGAGDRQRCVEWRQQQEDDATFGSAAVGGEPVGCYFVTEADLKGAGVKMDPQTRNVMTILRQVGRLREWRSGGLVRYVALSSFK